MASRMLHFTNTYIVTSHKNNAYFAFALQVFLHASHVHIDPNPHGQLNSKDIDMEKALLSYDVTSEVLVKWNIYNVLQNLSIVMYKVRYI